MDASSFNDLLNRYYTKTCTEQEQTVLAQLVKQPEYDGMLKEWLATIDLEADDELLLPEQTASSILNSIFIAAEKPLPVRKLHFLKTAWFRYAAALLLIVGTATFLYNEFYKTPKLLGGARHDRKGATDIAPGTTGAVLTLADGTQVVLDSMGNGVIATQNGAQVILQNGQLGYKVVNDKEAISYNTMTTPKGRQFQLLLPDGSKVWLNAASSLTYPTAFNGKERRVEVRGEAYFEIAKNKAKPFFIKIKDQAEVEVLGTSFNVNAYEDEESIKTTLLEGSVRVVKQGKDNLKINSIILKPGQQAQVKVQQQGQDNGLAVEIVKDADIDKVMAWKNGLFNFENASLEEVMQQVSRWYDIEVVYKRGIPKIYFAGKMSRDVSLAGLIEGLEGAEVHFRIEEGRRLVVYP